jgi:hypothetical protein
MSLLIDLIMGPLGAALGVLVSVAAAFIAGRSAARAGAERDAANEYREMRKEIDNADLGLGASDSERIKRLRELADGR